MKIREILLEYSKNHLKNNFEKKYEQKKNKDHSLPGDVSFDEFLKKIEIPLKQENKFQIIDPYMFWIVQNYVMGGIRYFEDIHSKTIPALLKYDSLKKKNKLKPEHRDIGKIKSLDDLLDILDGYAEEDIKSNKERDKEIERKFYESGEAELIYNDSEMKVVVPRTERASCFFGRNTRWCTAATKGRNMFDYYAKQGDLYIVLIKKNNERYQFNFETDQFMDEKDKPINTTKLVEKYPKLYDIFAPIAKRKGSIFSGKNLSEDEMLAAVKKNGKLIQHIKNPSKKVQLAAVRQNGEAIEYIENPSEEVQLAAVKQDADVIRYIKNPSEKVQLAAVNEYGDAIQYIENPSEKVQLVAVKDYGYAIRHIKNPSEKVQLAAIKRNPKAIEYIKNPTPRVLELVEMMTSDEPKSLKYFWNIIKNF